MNPKKTREFSNRLLRPRFLRAMPAGLLARLSAGFLATFGWIENAQAHALGAGCGPHQLIAESQTSWASLSFSLRQVWWALRDSSNVWEAHVGSTGRGRCGVGLEDIAIFAVIGTVLITVVRARRATIRQRLDLARSMVERGQEPPVDLLAPPGNDLHRGIVLIFAGLGLLAASYVSRGAELSPGGLIPLFIGLGYLFCHRAARHTQGPKS
jgi:hypothetical protein